MTEHSKIPLPADDEASLFERASGMFGLDPFRAAPVPAQLVQPARPRARPAPVAPAPVAEVPVEAAIVPTVEPTAPTPAATVPTAETAVAFGGERHAIDRERLQEQGMIVPEAGATALLEEFRIIKRQLIAAAQKIHVEFCNVPSYEAGPVVLQPRYGFLDDRYGGIVLQTESESEILADKMVALAGRKFLKARDVWDIRWLMQRGNQVDVDLVRLKAADYGMQDLSAKLTAAVERLRQPSTARAFVNEMQRFVSPSLAAAMLREDPPGRSWLEHAAKTASDVANTLHDAVEPPDPAEARDLSPGS